MKINTDGLVIREMTLGESDRLVTLLTREEGLVRAFARKAKSLRSTQTSSTGLLCYSRFSIYKGREKYIIGDARPIEVFFDLRSDLQKLSLAQYFCELAGTLAPEGSPAEEYLRLVLNALYFLSKGTRSQYMLKSIVEMRMISLAGYMPDLVACRECGCYESNPMYFLPQSGSLLCQSCAKINYPKEPSFPLSCGVVTALRHTIYADFSKLFSFSLSESREKQLSQVTEQYVLSTLQRGFKTLDFYHQMKD